MIRRAGVVLALVAGLLLVPAAPAVAAPADDIYALVNQARWSSGLPGLIRNPAMDQVAANWAAQMAANGTLSHNPDYASQIPGGWTAAAENVAQGYPSGAAMHDGWMNSAGHRANVLGDYTDIGIAFLSSGGTTWGVQVFGRYPGHVGPAAPAPPAPAPAPAAPAAPVETPTPSATPTPTATPTTAPGPTAEQTTDDPGGAAWWWVALPVGVVVAASAAAVLLRRRRHLLAR